MERNDTTQPQQHQHRYFTTTSTTPSSTNVLLPPTTNETGGSHHTVYPHQSVPPQMTSAGRKKIGRPRKYGTPEQAMAAKKTASSTSKEQKQLKQLGLGRLGGAALPLPGSSKKDDASQGFTTHVIKVVAGEDVGQKIMTFMKQSKREICILSASGTISNASLRQPGTSGGNVAYEGYYGIISLSGSYVRNETGLRTGGLSVCLSGRDGQIIGGAVGGPLRAAGPVQVIAGTFMVENKDGSANAKGDASGSRLPSPVAGGSVSNVGTFVVENKDGSANAKGDASGSRLASPVAGGSVSNVGFRSTFEASGGNPIDGKYNHQNFGASHYMMQRRQGLHLGPRSTDWRSGLDDRTGFDLTAVADL